MKRLPALARAWPFGSRVRALLRLLPCAAALVLAPAWQPAAAQSLGGSRRSVDRVHRHAVTRGLTFYASTRGVRSAARAGRMVRLTGTGNYRLHQVSLPYALPATRTFVERLASQYRRACGERLVVTSAVRPTAWAPENGSPRSVHPAGMAVDLRKPRGRCLTWLRRTLLAVEGAGVIEATEERRPAHFHVAVYPAPYRRYVTGRHGGRTKARATAARGSGRRAGTRGAASSR